MSALSEEQTQRQVVPIRVVSPRRGWPGLGLGELWRYRELGLAFARRDLTVRYRQTLLGVSWAILQPLVLTGIFTFVFHKVSGIGTGDSTPYPVFILIGLVFWQLFVSVLNSVSGSMVGNANMIQKIYFPRLVLPLSMAILSLVDFLVALILLSVALVYYDAHFTLLSILFIIPLGLVVLASAMGLGLVLASLNVKFRDARFLTGFLVSLLLFVTPVIYPLSYLDAYPTLRELILWSNPVATVITSARAFISPDVLTEPFMIVKAIPATIAFLFVGVVVFRKTEDYFADMI